jgi:hypothetical protein
MGIVKNLLMEDEDRGFSLNSGKAVCSECFNDEGIEQFIASNGASNFVQCSYVWLRGRRVDLNSL